MHICTLHGLILQRTSSNKFNETILCGFAVGGRTKASRSKQNNNNNEQYNTGGTSKDNRLLHIGTLKCHYTDT